MVSARVPSHFKRSLHGGTRSLSCSRRVATLRYRHIRKCKAGRTPPKRHPVAWFSKSEEGSLQIYQPKGIQSRREGKFAGDICIPVGFEAFTTVLPKSYGTFRRVGWSPVTDVSEGRSVTIFSVKQSKMKAIGPSETSVITSPVEKE